MNIKELSKEERMALKTFISKGSVNAMLPGKPGKDYLDFYHRAKKALDIILPLFSHDDQVELKDHFMHRDEVCLGAIYPNFVSRVAEVYKRNGIEPREL